MTDQRPRMSGLFGGDLSGGVFGLPTARLGESDGAQLVVLGAPSATPYASVGPYCSGAPAAIRAAFGWPGVLAHHDFDVGGPLLAPGVHAIDWGDLDYHETDFPQNRERIRRTVESVLAAGAVPMVMGGDDSIPIPVLQAYASHGPLTIVQIDAHIDWRDDVAGERMGLSSNMRRASEMGWVERIIQIGARGIGSARPSDYQDALDWGVTFFPMRSIVESGMDPVINAIPIGSNVFLTLDIDGLDPTVVPAVIGPAPGGLDYWQVVTIMRAIANRSRIAGFDLVELMPENDVGGRGALVAARLMAVMLGLIGQQVRTVV